MGVTLSYQAIPPTSNFYKRVRSDRKLNILMYYFFQTTGIFSFFNIDPLFSGDSIRGINDGLAYIIKKHHQIFGSELEASLVIAEYRHELMIACRDFPGIEGRWASMEKTGARIEERLDRELEHRNLGNPEWLLSSMLYGDGGFARDLWSSADEDLALISRETVHEGAIMLRQIDPQDLLETIEDGFDEACLDDFEQWRDLYLEADEHGDEILMNVL